MHITFKTIRYKNFLSTGNVWTEIDFENASTTLFMGQNGSGKSTLLDALCYVLFNKPFRNINKPQLKNSINQKNMLVEVIFTSGKDTYFIRRGMSPNVFEIHKNGKVIDQDAATKDYQEILEKNYLHMNYKTFKQVDILGSASFVPFMQLAAAHRREVIEDLLDIQIFSTMNVILKNKVVENNESLDRNYKSLEFVNEKIKVHETYLKSITQDINDRKSELTEKIKRLEEDREIEQAILDENLYNLNQLTTQTTGFSTLNKKLSKIVLLENQLNDKIRKLEKDKDFFVEHDNCPTCNQIIDAGFKEDTVQKKLHLIGETSGAVEEILKQRKEVENSIKEITAINNQISSVNIDVGIRRNKIKNYKDNIKELQTQVDDLSKKISSNTQDNQTIKELETQRDNLSSEIKKNLQMKEVYRASALILKDSGIKSRIIKQYIPIINKLINKYLASMDFFVQFELDETFNETIKSRYRDVFSYASFSEGEKSKIDLALLFTWRQISKMRNSASTNILILDEVFDGSLDGSSSDELLKILMELSKDSNIIVISHKTDQLQDKFDRVMKFEKKQNFSRMIEV